MTVEWRDIPGFSRYLAGSNGLIVRKVAMGGARAGVAKMRLDHNAYFRVEMTDDSGRSKARFVHRMILLAFVGSCPAGKEGCHNDGNPLNNAASNLRYGTKKENGEDRVRHGRTVRGSRHWKSRLSEDDIEKIQAMLKSKRLVQKDIAKQFGVSQSIIGNIATGKAWGWMTGGGVSDRRTQAHTRRILSVKEGREIVAKKASGLSAGSLARMYGVSVVTVYNTLKRAKHEGGSRE